MKDVVGAIIMIVMITMMLMILPTKASPILDEKDDPFVVKKIKVVMYDSSKAKYYGNTQKGSSVGFPPKAVIFDANRYNVGDTIYFENEIRY